MGHEIRFEEHAAAAYRQLPRQDARRLNQALDALAIAPLMGREFDPLFEEAAPPVRVRVADAGSLEVHYTVDENGIVWVRHLEERGIGLVT